MNIEPATELPVDERPRHHGKWSRRCPHCLSSALVYAPKGSLECVACKAVLTPPNPRAPAPSHATSACHPCWQDDHRLVDGEWDQYSRRGELVAEWGRSTDRQDGGPPEDLDEPEHVAPRVRTVATLGRQDELLDDDIREYVNETAGLRDALDALKRLALATMPAPSAHSPRRQAGTKPVPVVAHLRAVPVSPTGYEIGRKLAELASKPWRIGVYNTGEPATESEVNDGAVVDADAHLFKSSADLAGPAEKLIAEAVVAGGLVPERVAQHRADTVVIRNALEFIPVHPDFEARVARLLLGDTPHPLPRWHGAVAEAGRTALMSQYGALAIILVNALRRRGVAVDGSLDFVSPKVRRDTPFANYGHAMAAAFGVDEPGEGSPIPRNAMAKFTLPQGVVFDQIACKPSRNYAASAKELPLDDRDVWGAIERARVGARTFTEGGVIRREEGRPLVAWEIELVRLLDAGEERAEARRNKRTKRIDSLAVERLTPEEILPKLRGYEGAPRTVRELKLAAKAVRKAVRLELEDAQLIPGGRAAGTVDDLGPMDEASRAKRKKRRQTSPFPIQAAA